MVDISADPENQGGDNDQDDQEGEQHLQVKVSQWVVEEEGKTEGGSLILCNSNEPILLPCCGQSVDKTAFLQVQSKPCLYCGRQVGDKAIENTKTKELIENADKETRKVKYNPE